MNSYVTVRKLVYISLYYQQKLWINGHNFAVYTIHLWFSSGLWSSDCSNDRL